MGKSIMEIINFPSWIFLITLLVEFVIQVSSSGYFELQILEISNRNNQLLSGYCCGIPMEMRSSQLNGCPPCATAFRLCLKEYQSSVPSVNANGQLNSCSFGNASTSVLGGSSFVLADPEISSIVLPFSFRWTKSFTLILQALDLSNASHPISERLIEETTFSGVIFPSQEWHTLNPKGKNANITYRVRVQCDQNYYNTTCTTFCRPRNDRFGHYTCGGKGDKVCLTGWQGVNCEKAICKSGCDPTHGKCDKPGECECRPGWRGPLCSECMVYPGCRHGYCNGSPWQCICDTNWGGILCDQDLNYCGTHEPCMHGGTCENTAPDQYRCTCAEGLSGMRCEIVEHPCATQPCKNGGTCTLRDPSKYEQSKNLSFVRDAPPPPTAVTVRRMRGMSSMGKPARSNMRSIDLSKDVKIPIIPPTPPTPLNDFICTCAPGWTGPTCETNIDECEGGPCEHGGTCIDLVGGFRCECSPQWTGDLCQTDVDECESNPASPLGPCINAEACVNTPGAFRCFCLDGWTGPTCAKDIDDCIGQCKNGATCIDLVNNYYCACAVGYTGHNCETDIDECASTPCRNAGECVDMVGTFKCICPVGYSGTLCEEQKNYCTPTPCLEGQCMNTPGGYYCHCPASRSGRHCELPRVSCQNPPCHDSGCTPPSSNTTELSVPCSGNGQCETFMNGLFCVCQSGYTGHYCEHNLNECTPNPCNNGGICFDGVGDFSCECIPGWSGKTCSERITQCLPGQCLNGGTCIVTLSNSQCLCASGWGGPFCSEPLDQCQGQPCHNGGICESGPGWFRCVCAKGFSGPDCRINVNECSPQPCLGGATCQDGIGGFTCICPPGRQGIRCEILLSDPASVCYNSSTLSPYNPLVISPTVDGLINGTAQILDETNCNSCMCYNGKPKCTNIWCGLPNCSRSMKRNNSTICSSHEVCVPALSETCLSPPCDLRGDCRSLEPSRRVAPPKLPSPTDCWPNQAILGEQCSRITIVMDPKLIPRGTTVEGVCLRLRRLVGDRLIKTPQLEATTAFIVILCDIKSGSNDTIEVTLSSPGASMGSVAIKEAVKIISEVLSRHGNNLSTADNPEAASFVSIVEVKVETAMVSSEGGNSNYLIAVACGSAIAALCIGAIVTLFIKQRISGQAGSGVNLTAPHDVSRHDEEKSNNLQNEENFRRYANPIKGSASSLRGAMELSLNPAPEIAPVSSIAGPSVLHRSQPLFPSCDSEFSEKDTDNTSNSHKGSQNLLFKAQNPEVRKNTVGSFENSHKDFGKRAINCQTTNLLPPDSDGLTVHV